MTTTSTSNISRTINSIVILIVTGQFQTIANASAATPISSLGIPNLKSLNEQISAHRAPVSNVVNDTSTNTTNTDTGVIVTDTLKQYTTTTADPNEVIIAASTNSAEYTTITESSANISESNKTDTDQSTEEPVTGSQFTGSSIEASNTTSSGNATGGTIVSTSQPSSSTQMWTAVVTRKKLNVWPLWSIVMYRFPSTTPSASSSEAINIAHNVSLSQSKPAVVLKYKTLSLSQDKTCPFGYKPDMANNACVHLCENLECHNGGICYAKVDVHNQATAKCRCEETFEKQFKGHNCERWETGRVKERVITLGILVPLAMVLVIVYATLCNKVGRNRKEVWAMQRDHEDNL